MSLDTSKVTTITEGEEPNVDEIVRYTPQTKRGGKWVRFGLEEFRIPPLGFLDVQEMQPDVDALRTVVGAPTADQWRSVHAIVWAAMKRNYPSLTIDEVKERVDLGNWLAVTTAVFGVSGYTRVEKGPGELMPGPSIGTASTPL